MHKTCICQMDQCSQNKTCNCSGDKVCQMKLPTMKAIATQLKTICNQTACSVVAPVQQAVLGVGRGNHVAETFTCFNNSVDYCTANPENGIAGVEGRECVFDRSHISSPQHCNNLCCDRGAESFTIEVAKPCRCRFIWCCEITCETCKSTRTKYRCKSTN